jgi:hypothetical protein
MPKTMNPTHQPRSARTHWSCFVARRASTTSETSSAPSSDAATAKNVLSDPDRVTCGAVISASHHAAAAHANGKYATKARPSTGAPLRASSVRSINTAIANQKVARTMRVNALSSKRRRAGDRGREKPSDQHSLAGGQPPDAAHDVGKGHRPPIRELQLIALVGQLLHQR